MGTFLNQKKRGLGHRQAFALIVTLFFTWGFLGTLDDVLMTALRAAFHLAYAQATLVQVSFFLTFFLVSFPSAAFIRRNGYRRGIAAGLGGMAAGSALFVPAASAGLFPAFLVAVIVMASGSTLLQTAAGPYVALLGDEHSASSRFSLALGVNSLGSLLAPIFGSRFLLHTTSSDAAASSLDQVHTFRGPYIGIACALICLLLVSYFSDLPEIASQKAQRAENPSVSIWELRRYPRFYFGVMAMFLYVGAEIAIGGLLINYLGSREVLALPHPQAALLTSLYWAGAMVGRFGGWLVLRRFPPCLVLSIAATSAATLVSTSVFSGSMFAAATLLTVGLCNSVIVPVLFTHAIARLGLLTEAASGLLVAAMVGGACIPFLQGTLADRFGLHRSFLLPGLCYVCIAVYGYWQLRTRIDNGGPVTVDGSIFNSNVATRESEASHPNA